MYFELFLGLRYLKAKRKQAFISVITIISVVGVMMGVMALIVVLSVMNGFREDLMSKILGVNAHLWVLSYNGSFGDYEKVDYILLHGDPATEIIEIAKNGYDLLVIGARGSSRKGLFSMGSVVSKVIFHTDISVLVVR